MAKTASPARAQRRAQRNGTAPLLDGNGAKLIANLLPQTQFGYADFEAHQTAVRFGARLERGSVKVTKAEARLVLTMIGGARFDTPPSKRNAAGVQEKMERFLGGEES